MSEKLLVLAVVLVVAAAVVLCVKAIYGGRE